MPITLTSILAAQAAPVDRGEILLGELNCVACHAAPDAVRSRLASKQAPVLGAKGVRVTPQWLRAYLRDPQAAQPGTTMPDSLHALPPSEKDAAAEALTHFLVSLQGPPDARGAEYDAATVAKGQELYHTVGCVACHAPQALPGHEPDDARGRQTLSELQQNVAPLGDLASKTTVPQLAVFLQNPLATRPSGRMPASHLGDAEATAIAMYLQRAQKPSGGAAGAPGLRYEYYEEELTQLPRFERLHAKAAGVAAQINLDVLRRTDGVALRFRGNLTIPTEGEYTFTVVSDDGARLLIDDKQVLENDGIHPATEGKGHVALTRGDHALTVVYFNGTGERALNAYWEGPGFGRQEIPASALSHSVTPLVPTGNDPAFALDSAKVARGRTLFASLNCGSCHGGIEAPIGPPARTLAELDPPSPDGCLAPHAAGDRPQFTLTDADRAALQATLAAPAKLAQPLDAAARLDRTMTALNCYACHGRDGHGGPEGARRDYFTAAGEADLGDEGRFPPALTGVGAKLRPEAMAAIFWQGAVARPYMATRMPQFGEANMTGLPEAFSTADDLNSDLSAAEPADFPTARAAGHKLAGTGGLGCIACHNFAAHPALGVPAIDMTLMSARLKPAWFRRYLLDPQALRPGTRMPAFWPDGRASNQEVLAGDTDKQIAALRLYLSQGKLAELPDGLIPAKLELIARKEAILYRNFIAGVSPRAIAVGYPEKANLAFDADEGCLALLWQGGFIDASHQRTGRAQGAQGPLGGNVVTWTPGAPFARLSTPDAPWPQTTGPAAGYRFGGYRLDDKQRPTFLYRFGDLEIQDYPIAVQGDVDAGFRRTLRLQTQNGLEGVYFRAALGENITARDANTFLVDKKVTVKITGGGTPFLRHQGEKSELLVPVTTAPEGTATLEETLSW